MQIALLGATGHVGLHITAEAVRRGHGVTAVARHPDAARGDEERVTAKRADATAAFEVEQAISDHDAVISAVGPAIDETPSMIVKAARALAAAAMRAHVRRLVIVGDAGSLTVTPGIELLATRGYPAELREVALAHREALEVWRRVKDLDWTYVSPPAVLYAGARTGEYRVGHNEMLTDDHQQSRISVEDLAVAVVDQVENNAHVRERINVAY
ncbi:MAG TPA: NAD(P)H-binding protein [Polyangiaceae bacterium]